MTIQRTLLLSLRPRFADAILAGNKTVELRRRPVNAEPGTPIILYASSPTMAIVGTARLREVRRQPHQAAWREHHRSLGLSRAEFDAYLDGSAYAYLLLLHRVCELDEPLSLRRLQQDGSFRPPQSFRYVAATDPVRLHHLVTAATPTEGRPRGDRTSRYSAEAGRTPKHTTGFLTSQNVTE